MDTMQLDTLMDLMPKKALQLNAVVLTEINEGLSCSEIGGPLLKDEILSNQELMEKYNVDPLTYIRAVKFIAYLSAYQGKHLVKAYAKAFAGDTFIIEKGGVITCSDPKSSSYESVKMRANRFRSSGLVSTLYKQIFDVKHLSYYGEFHIAMNTLAEIAQYGVNDRDRVAACDALLKHIKVEETDKGTKVEVNVNTQNNSVSLLDNLRTIAEGQKQAVLNGVDLKEAQKVGLPKEQEVLDVINN